MCPTPRPTTHSSELRLQGQTLSLYTAPSGAAWPIAEGAHSQVTPHATCLAMQRTTEMYHLVTRKPLTPRYALYIRCGGEPPPNFRGVTECEACQRLHWRWASPFTFTHPLIPLPTHGAGQMLSGSSVDPCVLCSGGLGLPCPFPEPMTLAVALPLTWGTLGDGQHRPTPQRRAPRFSMTDPARSQRERREQRAPFGAQVQKVGALGCAVHPSSLSAGLLQQCTYS